MDGVESFKTPVGVLIFTATHNSLRYIRILLSDKFRHLDITQAIIQEQENVNRKLYVLQI